MVSGKEHEHTPTMLGRLWQAPDGSLHSEFVPQGAFDEDMAFLPDRSRVIRPYGTSGDLMVEAALYCGTCLELIERRRYGWKPS